MKIIIKEITANGDNLLVYKMTDTNQPISCVITKKDELIKTIKTINSISNKLPQERYSYSQYLEQDEITQ